MNYVQKYEVFSTILKVMSQTGEKLLKKIKGSTKVLCKSTLYQLFSRNFGTDDDVFKQNFKGLGP